MDELWLVLEHWLGQNFPEVIADLNPGCSDEELNELERQLNCRLPEDFKALYRCHNGQRGQATGIFCGLPFLSTDEIYEQWTAWRDLAKDFAKEAEDFDDENLAAEITGESYPANAIKPTYINLQWIPFSDDGSGNHLGVDLDPGSAGVIGQVINFGTDENDKFVIASSLPGFIAWIVAQYQADNYQHSEHSLNLQEPVNTSFLDVVPLLFGEH